MSAFLLDLNTATVSDGGDMNWTLHVIGATGFFIVTFYNFIRISFIVENLYEANNEIIPKISYLYKIYSLKFILILASVFIAS